MKRFILSILFTAAFLLCSGCGQGNSSAAAFTQDDLRLTINSASYRCNIHIDTVIDDLGDDYDYAEGMSCDYDGLDKTYLYDVATFYTNPLSEGDLVNEIYTEHPAVSTSKGITVGSTRDAVLAAYGEDCEDLGDLLIYSLPGERPSLCFELDDGVVWAIYLTTQPV